MEPPLTLTREQVRRVDEIAVTKYGMSSLVLMENAGRGVVDVLLSLDPALVPPPPQQLAAPPSGPSPEGLAHRLERLSVAILAGKGNNAGDGFVIARHLAIRGVAVGVFMVAPYSELTGDARANADILIGADVPMIQVRRSHAIELQLNQHAARATWLIDAMLGTGATGEPREPFAAAIQWMNAQPASRLAIDLPSGLDCDTGVPAATTVRADVTCTLVALKPGFLEESAKRYLGDVRVVSIGVPPRLVREAAGV